MGHRKTAVMAFRSRPMPCTCNAGNVGRQRHGLGWDMGAPGEAGQRWRINLMARCPQRALHRASTDGAAKLGVAASSALM